MLADVNRERTRHGLKALRIDRGLQAQTRKHCRWMAETGSFEHSPGNLIENIAEGHADSSVVLAAWMEAAGHRANILDPAALTIGVAGYVVEGGKTYWVQRFRR